MSCEPIIENGKTVGFMCSTSKEAPKIMLCYKCGKPASKLCDFQNSGLRTSTDDYGRKLTHQWASLSTCDKPMCSNCANHARDEVDFCDEHNNEFSFYKTVHAEIIHREHSVKNKEGKIP